MLKHLYDSYGSMPIIWLSLALTAFSQIIGRIAIPITISLFVANVLYNSNSSIYYAFIFLLSYFASVLIGYTADYIFVKYSDGRYENLVGRFYDEISAKPISYFRSQQSGRLGTLFRNHMDGTINLFRIFRTDVIPIVITSLGPAIVLMSYNYVVGLIFFMAVLSRGCLSWIAANRNKYLRRKALDVYGRLSGVMGDHMANLSVVRVSANYDRNKAAITDLAAREAKLFWARHRDSAKLDSLGNALVALCFFGIFCALAQSDMRGRDALFITVASIIFVIQAMSIAQGVGEFHQRWGERWEHTRSSLAELVSDGCLESRPNERNPIQDASVELRSVDFGYRTDGQNLVLKSVDLRIDSGKKIVIVGPNGVGKSTLVNLIMRFDAPISGVVDIFGGNINQLSDATLYRNIGYVPQEPRLFNTTIEDNLMFFEPNAQPDRISAAFAVAGIPDLISDLPDGLKTEVGEMGSKISAGQRQRVAIARALLRDAPLYVLDEPTSALHGDAELQIMRNIINFTGPSTLIVITHSLRVTELFDDVLEVSDAGIVWLRQS